MCVCVYVCVCAHFIGFGASSYTCNHHFRMLVLLRILNNTNKRK